METIDNSGNRIEHNYAISAYDLFSNDVLIKTRFVDIGGGYFNSVSATTNWITQYMYYISQRNLHEHYGL
jgi:hypothetical protein